MAVQTARGAVAFADFLVGLKARLVSVLTVPGDPDPLPVGEEYVRVLAHETPDESGSEFRAEQGVTLRVGAAEPVENCGAGRTGWKVARTVVAYVTTMNLLDAAGDDLIAVKEHMAVEEAVVDAVVDAPPAGEANSTFLPIRVTWVPGGTPPTRRAGDFGVLQSSVVFRCEYVARLTTNRD